MLDGVRLAENLHALIAVGIYTDGHKEILGFRIGSSESYEVSCDLVGDLVNRSLKTADNSRLLAVLDGSDALRRAVLKFFPDAVIQKVSGSQGTQH